MGTWGIPNIGLLFTTDEAGGFRVLSFSGLAFLRSGAGMEQLLSSPLVSSSPVDCPLWPWTKPNSLGNKQRPQRIAATVSRTREKEKNFLPKPTNPPTTQATESPVWSAPSQGVRFEKGSARAPDSPQSTATISGHRADHKGIENPKPPSSVSLDVSTPWQTSNCPEPWIWQKATLLKCFHAHSGDTSLHFCNVADPQANETVVKIMTFGNNLSCK